jgi:hypothetical protein
MDPDPEGLKIYDTDPTDSDPQHCFPAPRRNSLVVACTNIYTEELNL